MKEGCPPSEGLGRVPGSRVWDWSNNSGWSQQLPDAWTGPPDPSPAARSGSTSCQAADNVVSCQSHICNGRLSTQSTEQISIQ